MDDDGLPEAGVAEARSTSGEEQRPRAVQEHLKIAPNSNIVYDAIKWVETVAIPVGAVSGLLVFFGWTYSSAYFGYFGISQRMLQYSIQDQMLLSADVTFGTAVLMFAVVVAILLLDRLLAPWRGRQGRLGLWTRRSVPAIGVLLFGVGLLSAAGLSWLPIHVPARVAAIAFLAGAIIVLRADLDQRKTGKGESPRGHLIFAAALLLSAFWMATLYAQNAGETFGRQIDEAPTRLALVTVFSEKYIDLPGSAVIATEEVSVTGSPLYRYGGLRLLAFSNDRWFLLTGRYDGYRSSVTVLMNGDSFRVEVAKQH